MLRILHIGILHGFIIQRGITAVKKIAQPGGEKKAVRRISRRTGFHQVFVHFSSRLFHCSSTHCWACSSIHSLPGLKQWAKRPCSFI